MLGNWMLSLLCPVFQGDNRTWTLIFKDGNRCDAELTGIEQVH